MGSAGRNAMRAGEEGTASTSPASSHKPLIALTGATGFIGQHLLRELPKRGYRLRVLLRRPSAAPIECASALIGDLARPHNMSEALAEVDAVIHTAGVAQTMSGVPEDDYRLLNTEATMKLARAAERVGVRRFVFLSSIRAQSGSTAEGVLTETLEPRPTDAYGRSKLAAEQGLAETNLDWVALRLVLVYGPGVQGNMARLAELARSPYPLPLASLKAKRSLLALDNLVEAVAKVLDAPKSAEAPVHRGRSGAADRGRDDHGHAPWTWPARRPVPGAEPGAESSTSGPWSCRDLSAVRRLARRR